MNESVRWTIDINSIYLVVQQYYPLQLSHSVRRTLTHALILRSRDKNRNNLVTTRTVHRIVPLRRNNMVSISAIYRRYNEFRFDAIRCQFGFALLLPPPNRFCSIHCQLRIEDCCYSIPSRSASSHRHRACGLISNHLKWYSNQHTIASVHIGRSMSTKRCNSAPNKS